MKIGILGGSFDPIHIGHLSMAEQAYHQYELDKIWIIPNGHPPHKDENEMTLSAHRLAMCKLAASEYDYMDVNSIEIESAEYSYTYITMEKLTALYPSDCFYFIMGADSLDYFDKWKYPEKIAALCKILVVNRDDFTVSELENKIRAIQNQFFADISIVHCPKVDVSSTEIRKGVKTDGLLPSVYKYICENHLYGY